MSFELTPLGTGAALPARGRHPSAQLLNVHGTQVLIDCGEGTQERLRAVGANFNRIGHVLISHLHGDHYLGLMGLLSSMHLQGRTADLHVYGPPALREIVDIQLRASGTYLRYPLHMHALLPETGGPVFEDVHVRVVVLALRHRLPCTGFLFTESGRPRTLRKDRVSMVPHYRRNAVKSGEDLVLPDGSVVPNSELTTDPPRPRRYAYCSDTAPAPELVPVLQGVDLLYHEATFTEMLAARARETLHSTARQAAELARDARAGRLLLGHFSSRYKNVAPLLDEARAVFPRTFAAEEGVMVSLDPPTAV